MNNYDLVVIGTGAGNTILEAALTQGLKCAVIERGKFGGTCLNRGCTPTKVLAAAADNIIQIKNARTLGIKSSDYNIDWNIISNNVWNKINNNKELLSYFDEFDNLDIYQGTASFVDNTAIKVVFNDDGEEELIKGEKIFINVGGRTKIPDFEGLEDIDYVTSESFFGYKWPEKPYENLIILGGGPIGVEFAHIFSAFGGNVSIVQHNIRLLPKEDEEISKALAEHFEERGINLYLNQDTVAVHDRDGIKHLKIKNRSTGEEKILTGETVFVAPGIMSNGDSLNLENTSIKTDSRGFIETNEFLETSVPGIWALGDVNGNAAFRHKANYEAEIIAHNLFYKKNSKDLRWASYDLVPAVTFSSPQVAHIGLTEAQAIKMGYDIQIGYHHYYQTVKGYAMGFRESQKSKNFAKAVVEKKSKKILGLHIIGPEASILIQPFVNLMNAGHRVLKPLNAAIEHEMSQRARSDKTERYLDPAVISTVLETMSPHPALSEIPAWIGWFLE